MLRDSPAPRDVLERTAALLPAIRPGAADARTFSVPLLDRRPACAAATGCNRGNVRRSFRNYNSPLSIAPDRQHQVRQVSIPKRRNLQQCDERQITAPLCCLFEIQTHEIADHSPDRKAARLLQKVT